MIIVDLFVSFIVRFGFLKLSSVLNGSTYSVNLYISNISSQVEKMTSLFIFLEN